MQGLLSGIEPLHPATFGTAPVVLLAGVARRVGGIDARPSRQAGREITS